MEHRREFEEGDEIVCPRCDSDELEPKSYGEGYCNNCGLEFSIRQLLVWESGQPDLRGKPDA